MSTKNSNKNNENEVTLSDSFLFPQSTTLAVINSLENSEVAVQKHDDDITTIALDREEILRKRKERKEQKRFENKLKHEQEKLQEKLNRNKSEKLQIVSSKTFQKYKASTSAASISTSSTATSRLPINQIKRTKLRAKIQKDFNLFDFFVEKKKECKPLRRLNIEKPLSAQKLNCGKKCEIPKTKCYSRLRRIILKNRELKKKENVLGEDNKNTTEEEVKDKTEDIKEKKEESFITKTTESHQESSTTKTTNSQEESLATIFETLEISKKKINKKSIHSRRFRTYCDNTTSKELCNLTENLLRDLFRFQKRAYEKNQIKARAHKRYVIGFKEVVRQLDIHKTKLIIFAPDCENCELPGRWNLRYN